MSLSSLSVYVKAAPSRTGIGIIINIV